MRRRAFLKSAACAGVGALAPSQLVLAAGVEIEITPDKPGATMHSINKVA